VKVRVRMRVRMTVRVRVESNTKNSTKSAGFPVVSQISQDETCYLLCVLHRVVHEKLRQERACLQSLTMPPHKVGKNKTRQEQDKATQGNTR
jgi:hypothetical protein